MVSGGEERLIVWENFNGELDQGAVAYFRHGLRRILNVLRKFGLTVVFAI